MNLDFFSRCAEKAFDKVPYQRLIEKLKSHGIVTFLTGLKIRYVEGSRKL